MEYYIIWYHMWNFAGWRAGDWSQLGHDDSGGFFQPQPFHNLQWQTPRSTGGKSFKITRYNFAFTSRELWLAEVTPNAGDTFGCPAGVEEQLQKLHPCPQARSPSLSGTNPWGSNRSSSAQIPISQSFSCFPSPEPTQGPCSFVFTPDCPATCALTGPAGLQQHWQILKFMASSWCSIPECFQGVWIAAGAAVPPAFPRGLMDIN